MHPLFSPTNPTFLLPLLLTTLTDAYQIKSRQEAYSNSANALACNTRSLPNTNTNPGSNLDITSKCIAQFQTTCKYSLTDPPSLQVPSINPNQPGTPLLSSCNQQDFSKILPGVTLEVCLCACQCAREEPSAIEEVQELQAEEYCIEKGGSPVSCSGVVSSTTVSSAASVSTSAWSNSTATVTGSAPASITSKVRALGPQEGFERKRMM